MQSTKAFNKKYFKKLSKGFIILLILFAGSVFLFIYLIHEVLWEKEEAVDNYILNFLSASIINSHLTIYLKGITYLASATFLKIAYAGLVITYLLKKNWKRAVEIAVIGIGGFIVNYLMKLFFHRVRPPHPLINPLRNFSFPSGHATSAIIFYGLLAYLIWKTDIPKPLKYFLGSLLLLFAILIGFSRIYLRLHYPSDVLAGFCIGFAWVSLSIWLLWRLKKKSDVELTQQQV